MNKIKTENEVKHNKNTILQAIIYSNDNRKIEHLKKVLDIFNIQIDIKVIEEKNV